MKKIKKPSNKTKNEQSVITTCVDSSTHEKPKNKQRAKAFELFRESTKRVFLADDMEKAKIAENTDLNMRFT